MEGHQASSEQVSVNSDLLGVYCYAMHTSSDLHHQSVHALNMSTIIVFVHLRLQFKWNQLSPNNSRHSSCIHKGLHAGKWPDSITPQPDAVSSLHWDTTWQTTLEPNWLMLSSIGLPVAIQCWFAHWKTTGATSTLGCHWNHTDWC